MSLRVPLSVRLKTSRGDLNITHQLRGLRFRSTIPGGFASITAELDRPLSLQPDEIGYYGSMYVYDGRSGETVCEGRLEDPDRTASDAGQVWRLSAVGPSAHAQDRVVPLIYVDDPMRTLHRVDNVTPGGSDSVGTDPGHSGGSNEALVLQFPQGLTVAVNSRVVMRYLRLMESGQKLARIDYTWDAGTTNSDLNVEAVARTDGGLGSGEAARSDNFNTAGGGSSPKEIVTDFASGRNTIEWRIIVDAGAGGTLGSDVFWASIRNMVVVATRFNRSGSELLTAADYSANTVLASDVVADLLGRLLTSYDGANASITTTSHAITQLAYPDGTDAGQVLDDLIRLEGDYYWAAWESNSAGKNRFEWRAWPASVRYECDVVDGIDSPGSATELFNAVTVRWTDGTERIRSTTRTLASTVLTAAGLTRTALLDLGDEVGSLADAQRAGDEFLIQHQYPPNAGRLAVSRPILDIDDCRMVSPWEIRPGHLIRVRGILPRVDALNATSRDGVTVFRIVGVEYDADGNAANLELDSRPRTTAHTIAGIARSPALFRRRR